jgi:hypothetical protein
LKPRKILTNAIAIIIILFSIKVYTEKPLIENADLYNLTITAKDNIKTISGRYTKYGYSLLAKEYPSTFIIDNCVNFVCNSDSIKEIKSGDKLEIMIENYYKDQIENTDTEIPIFSLTINDNHLFSLESYLLGESKQKIRIIALSSILILAIAIFNIEKIKPVISWKILISYIIVVLSLIETKIL